MNALFHSRFAETFGWMLLHSLWQLALIAGLWAAALGLLRRASASARYLLASLGLVLMLVAPVFTYASLLPPAPRAPALAGIPEELVVTVGSGPVGDLPTASTVSPPPAVSWPLATRLRMALTPWLPWAVGGYFLGMAAMVLRLLAGYAQLRRFVSRGTILQGRVAALALDLARRMNVRRTIHILQSAAIEVPTLLGALKPVILLPASALTGLSPDQLTAVLAHEIAHIRRHDYLANVMQSLIETLLFYHPAAWWLSARIRHERELCCDDAAIAATSDRLAYARALATMESLRVPAGVALAAAGGPLLTRIRRILGTPSAPQPGRLFSTFAAVVILALVAAAGYVGCNESAPVSPAVTTASQQLVADSAIRDRLQEDLDQLAVEKQPLEKVLDLLRERMAVPMTVRWEALERAGVSRNTPVTFSLKQIPYRKLLAAIFALAGGPDSPLTYKVDGGSLIISTQNEIGPSVHTFDIRYILNLGTPPSASDRRRMVQNVIDTIQSTVAPKTWQANGGTLGTITENDGRITVSQTAENLDAVNKMLEQLFETRAMGVYMECRAYLVSSNFLDDFRVAWALGIPFEGDPPLPPPNNATVIDNWTLNLLLTAAQADRRSISLTACALTPNGYSISVDILPPANEAARLSGKDFAGLHLSITPTASVDRRWVILDGLRPARITTVPAPIAPATGRPAATTMLSTPDGGTLLINGGPVADSEGKPTYRLLILVRPNLRLAMNEGRNVLFETAGGMRIHRPDTAISAPPSTAPEPGQILVKAVIVELDADAFAKLMPGGATQPATTYGMAPTSQSTGRVALLEKPDDALKELEKLAAAKQAQIVSRPSILAVDGQEADIMIGQQVPFVRGYYTDPEKGRSPAVDYRQVGIRLGVVPKTMQDGLVQLDIDASISALANVQPPPDPATGMPPIGTPVIDERTAKVRLAVKDGATVVLALQPAKAGKETLVFITPHVAPNAAELPVRTPAAPESPAPDPRP